MPVFITQAAPAGGGPLSGRLTDAVLDTTSYGLALFYYASGQWQQKGGILPVVPLWSTGMIPQGNTRCAAALVTLPYTGGAGLPVVGPTVLAVATSDASRLSFTQWPGSSATVAGTARVTPWASYGVLFWAYTMGSGWAQVGSLVPLSTSNGSWQVTNSPTGRPQYAALLVPNPYTPALPTDGTLPTLQVVTTLFSAGVTVVFTSPKATGGALPGVVTGLVDARGLAAVAFSIDANNQVTARAFAACQKSGALSFAQVQGGAQYAVAVYDLSLEELQRSPPDGVPVVGGHVVASLTQSASP